MFPILNNHQSKMTVALLTLMLNALGFVVSAAWDLNPMNMSSLVLARQIKVTLTNNGDATYVWLFTGLNTTARIELTMKHFGITQDDKLFIGTDHNVDNDDSIFIRLKGGGYSFSVVSSGHKLWMRVTVAKVNGNVTYRTPFNVYGDIYYPADSLIECLANCQCLLIGNELEVQCLQGWNYDTLEQIPEYTSHLSLGGGNMTHLREQTFTRFQHLRSLALLKNEIDVIKNNTFDGLDEVQLLNLSSNCINSMEPDAFNGLPNLFHLDIRVNKLEEFQPDRLRVLPALNKMYSHNNEITKLPTGLCNFFQIHNGLSVRLDGNKISRIPPGIFNGCVMIVTLKLSRNRITHLNNGSFQGLSQVFSLELSRNDIQTIDPGAFSDASSLRVLRLKENNIVSFQTRSFIGLTKVVLLDLRYNPWVDIEPFAFWGLHNLSYLFLQRSKSFLQHSESNQSKGTLSLSSLEGLNSLEDMFVDDYRLCCLKPNVCEPQTPMPLFHTCKRLMPNIALRLLLWVFGISAMAGNIYVITLRCHEKNVRNPAQAILIVNLAISDFLMGFYMLIVAGADMHFGREFFIAAEVWKSSRVCLFAGFLSLFASEASVFFVVLISLDRLLCVALPFGKKRMTVYLAKVSCMIVWAAVTLIGVISLILQMTDTDAYDLATVCVGIPLVSTKKINMSLVKDSVKGASGESLIKHVSEITDTASKWQFAIAIYLGLNFVAFLIVLGCYVAIGAIVATKLPSKQLHRQNDRSREIKMAGKMAMIVFTDFACWMPVIILGILIQSGAVQSVPIEAYAWIVALVLPLNSALNPYIYTISTEITKLKRRRKEKMEAYTLRKMSSPSQAMNSQSKTSRFTNL